MVGIGGFAYTNTSGEALRTIALGSCVALIFTENTANSIGMIHIALPDSQIDLEKAAAIPGYFADTGIPALLNIMKKKFNINEAAITAKLVGGANRVDAKELFNIGKRNILAVKKILWQHGIGVMAEDVGGDVSRNVTVEVDSREILVEKSDKKIIKL